MHYPMHFVITNPEVTRTPSRRSFAQYCRKGILIAAPNLRPRATQSRRLKKIPDSSSSSTAAEPPHELVSLVRVSTVDGERAEQSNRLELGADEISAACVA